MGKFLLKNVGEIRNKRRQLRDKYDRDNHVCTALARRATLEPLHRNRAQRIVSPFLPFSRSLVHSPSPFRFTFLIRPFPFLCTPLFLPHSHPKFSTLYLIPIFPLFLHLFRSSIAAPPSSSFILVSPSILVSTVSPPHAFRPLSSLPLPLARSLARSPSRGQPRSLSLAPTLFLCSISFAGKSEATGSYVACGFTNRARLLNRFLSLVLLLAGGTQQRRARCSLRARFPLSEKSRPNDSAGESS